MIYSGYISLLLNQESENQKQDPGFDATSELFKILSLHVLIATSAKDIPPC